MAHFFFLNPLPFLQVRRTIQGTAVGVSHCVSYTFSLTKHPHPNFFCRSRNRNRLFSHTMSYRRDIRNSRSAIFDDGLEEGGLRASSSYSHSINEHDNDKAIDSLQDRVIFLKRLTGDIHEEVESHNHLLDRMGNKMDISRGIMSGTMDRFKMVFEKKSGRRTCILAGVFVVSFLIIYYLIRIFW